MDGVVEKKLKDFAKLSSEYQDLLNIKNYPPVKRLRDVKFIDSATLNGMCPSFMDRDGVFYGGTNTGNIVKTTDFVTSTVINTGIDSATYGVTRFSGITTTLTGRIIVGTENGYVFVSDESGANFTQKFHFTNGKWRCSGNHYQYDNVILIGSYEVIPDACEVYLSLDYGATWTKIFDQTDVLRYDPAVRLHNHGLLYDPYDSRIWVTTGDIAHYNTYYSDDWGVTWTAVYDGTLAAPQMGALYIVPFAYGTFHLYNQDYNCWLPRDYNTFRKPIQKEVFSDPQKYNFPYYGIHIKTELAGQGYPRGFNHVMVAEYDFLDTYMFATNDESCIMASQNGLQWYEIYRHPVRLPEGDGFASHPLGPAKNDTARKIYCWLNEGVNDKILCATLPE
jgi:hypothetical protein